MAQEQIPLGVYCYDQNGCCPHWRREGNWVYCQHLKIATEVADAPEPEGPHDKGYEYVPLSLVWDQVKECGVNDEDPDEI
jgi:hypothetical protein